MATLDTLEGWLIAIAQHTRETKEAAQAFAKPAARAGAAPAPGSSGAGMAEKLASAIGEIINRRLGRDGGVVGAGLSMSGALIDKMATRIEGALQSGLASGLGQVQGLKARGMSGTLEQARLDYAMEQLSRQFAAVFKPVTDAMTYAAVQIERRMRSMSGSEQNRMMGGLLGAGVGYRYGGVPGAVFGGAMGMGMMDGGSSTGVMAGAAAGAYLGYRTAGPVGGLVGGAVGMVGGTSRSYEGETGTDYYNRMRRPRSEGGGGASVVGAYMSGMGEAVRRWFENPLPGRPPGRRDEPRRDVTPFSSEQMEAGGTAQRIQQGIIRATAGAEFEENNPFKPIIDAILAKLDQVISAVTGVPAPPPATANPRG